MHFVLKYFYDMKLHFVVKVRLSKREKLCVSDEKTQFKVVALLAGAALIRPNSSLLYI